MSSPAIREPWDLGKLHEELARVSDDADAALPMRSRTPRRELGGVVVALQEVGSTQDEARALARAGAPDGTVVLAESQTSGRGRRGRSWRSPPGGGIWATVILRFARPPNSPALLTLAGAVAVCEAVRERGALAAEIKWPNDLVVETREESAGGSVGKSRACRKFAGVLGEMLADGRETIALLGLGVDVDLDPARLGEEIARDAISLRVAGLPPAAGREELLASILRRLEGVAPAEVLGEPDLLARWTALSPSSSGRLVVIEEAAIGKEGRPRLVRGTTRGIAPDGALRLEREDGETIEVRHGGTLRFEADADAESQDRAIGGRRRAARGGG